MIREALTLTVAEEVQSCVVAPERDPIHVALVAEEDAVDGSHSA